MSIHEKKHSLKMRLAYEHYQRVFQVFFSSMDFELVLSHFEKERRIFASKLLLSKSLKKILARREEEGEGESAHR